MVESGFDVREFEVEGVRFTDLTVRYELAAGVGVSPDEVDAVWERALAGVERVFNSGDEVFADGRVLHVTLERVDGMGDPHARVTVVPAGGAMDQFQWPVNAPVLGPVHEVGHQLGLRDDYPEEGAKHRGEGGAGHLMGFFDLLAAEGLTQGGVRPRDLAIIRVQADQAQDLESFRRSRAAHEAAGQSRAASVVPSSARAGAGRTPTAQRPGPDVFDHSDPDNPRNVLTTEYLERRAGVLDPAGRATSQTAKLKAGLTAAGKKAKARAGTARTMDEVVTRTGRELLLKLGRHAGRGRSLDLYRAMSFEEAQNVLGYWNSPARALAEQYVQTGRGTAKEFKQQYQGMTLGAHLAGLEQASVYHSMDSAGYQVLLKFTLKPGAHTVMFDPQFMALGPGYHAELLRRAGGDYQAASQHEGTLPGYIGMKAERHGAFSLTLAQGAHTKGTRSVGPSQLLFQLMVETVTLVSNTSDYLLPGQPTPAIVHTGPPRTTPRIAPRAPQAQLTEHLPEDTGKSRAALSAAFLDAPGNERSLATEHPYGTDTRRSPAETESHGVADELPTIDGRTVVGVPGRDRFVVRAERGKAPELISLRGDAEGNRFEVADVQAGGSVFTVRELDSGGSVVHGWTYRRMGPRLGVSQEVVALSSGFFSGSVVTVSNSTVHDVSVDGALWLQSWLATATSWSPLRRETTSTTVSAGPWSRPSCPLRQESWHP
ncbi:hypothetical protein ACFQ51_54865 [Streptomyces kaempferi]